MKPRLLVLDDDHNILALLRTYFSGLGWHVEACAEASAGLHLADSDAPFEAATCVLPSARAHPRQASLLLCRALLRRPRSAVVLFTGAAGDGSREEALRRGADDVIAKPVPLARLRDAALRAMKKP
jgi:DNA-binding response OmpR family regulator